MLVLKTTYPPLEAFQKLMHNTNDALNRDARLRPAYYSGRSGSPLEDDVKAALEECSKGTLFESKIEKISGHRFPDIVAAKYYGVEVKSTKEDHWTSTGSSILETTRVSDVERIYMTFGKLGGDPIEFLSKPYEECLYGIAVTHMPRYLIDMQLEPEQTIFSKMGISYDELRNCSDPIAPVAKYYRSRLKPGESLWWTGNAAEETVPPTIRLLRNLSSQEKNFYLTYALVNFPELFGSRADYGKYALWLASRGIVDYSLRDNFSSGGQEPMALSSGELLFCPAVYRRVKECKEQILRRLQQDDTTLFDAPAVLTGNTLRNRVNQWASMVSHQSPIGYERSMDVLNVLFHFM